jgi:asparagine synthase (glutamine-hydrolysing)
MTNLMTSEAKRALLRDPGDWPDSLDTQRGQLQRFGPGDPLAQALYTYCQDWLVEDLLMKADRMSMGVSLELRTPFLDYRLVEFAARLPNRLRVGPDGNGGYRTKLILRRFAERRLPAETIERPKQGFPVPVYGWLSTGLRDWARECLLGGDARIGAWCNSSALRKLVTSGTVPEGGLEDRHRVWNLLIFELWARRWL